MTDLRVVLARVRDGYTLDNDEARVLGREVARLRLLLQHAGIAPEMVEGWSPETPAEIEQFGAMVRALAKEVRTE